MTGNWVSRHPKVSVFDSGFNLQVWKTIMVQNKKGQKSLSWICRDYIPLDLKMILQEAQSIN